MELISAGWLADGGWRDARIIQEMNFTWYSGFLSPVDTKYRGKMTWFDVPAEINGVHVNSGDLVFGDLDGVLIIPRDAVQQVLSKSMDKVMEENVVRDKLAGGETLEKMFAEHGIL